MAQVIRPQVPDDNLLKNVLTIGGGIAGAVYGGPGGAVAGAGAGQLAGGILSPQKPPQENPQSGGGEAAAMTRKQQQMSQDTLGTLKQAEASLPTLPENLRQQYAPAIIQARMLEEQKRGMG